MTSPIANAAARVRGSRKILAGLALVLGIILACVAFFRYGGPYRIYRFRQEQVRLEQENARLAAENARLARTIDRLQHDPEMIQDLIRRELNFVKRNEIIFQMDPAAGSQPQTPPLSSMAGPRDVAASAGNKGRVVGSKKGAPGRRALPVGQPSPPGNRQ